MDELKLSSIRMDGGTQPRREIDEATVVDYAEAMRLGSGFPPPVVFHDGAAYWLADGFHRVHAARRIGLEQMAVDLRHGTKREAVLFSVGANAEHGLRRSNADKRKAVETLLADSEWATWSNIQIAKACNVSDHLVADVRRVTPNSRSEEPARTYTTKHGTVATMDTAKIGKREKSAQEADEKQAPQHTHAPESKVGTAPPPRSRDSVPEEPSSPAPCERCAELEETLSEVQAEVESLGRVVDADDKVAEALAEVKRVREMNRVLQERVNGLTGQLAEMTRTAKKWKGIVDRTEREGKRAAAQPF